MHINQLTPNQLQQQIGQAAHQADLCNFMGDKKGVKKWKTYERACMARLNEISPAPDFDGDQLLAELLG